TIQANLSAKKAVYSPKMNRLNYGLRGQVRSYTVLLLILAEGRGSGLVREKGGVFSKMHRLNYGLRGQVRSYTVPLLILAEGRGRTCSRRP
ncbi:hypothetical protein, partial [Pseudomonas syringae group genomosp. 3]|uniref:hypothetical protein n=1 Tax=Pseudomonas syringae group genomosp. 3 TaxID=251701 RepID=UPI001C7F9E86